jgi:hypothetical protein
MNIRTAIIFLAMCVPGLAACATDSEPVMNDGIAATAPVGTNLKNRNGYRRGGTSSSVKVLSREQIEEDGATADDILRPD